MDYGAKIADEAVAKTARKIRRVYRQAAKDLQNKLADFKAKHAAKQAKMLEDLNAEKISKAVYDSWMAGQVFIGKQWQDKVDQTVKIMQDANKEAARLVANGRLNVFAENYNFQAYQLEKKVNGVVSFNLYNQNTVERLIKKKPKMLPQWKIDQPKDYKWNRQKVENCITQGIIQGESIDQITNRLVENLCTVNENRMRTFSRTAITGAQNAGRLECMEEANEEGIKTKKMWRATLDSRTRDAHQDLDGQVQEVNEPFDSELGDIMFPGDPNAEPANTYNCRCTLDYVVEGYENHGARRAYREWEDEKGRKHKESYIVKDMTYSEWKKWKEGR